MQKLNSYEFLGDLGLIFLPLFLDVTFTDLDKKLTIMFINFFLLNVFCFFIVKYKPSS